LRKYTLSRQDAEDRLYRIAELQGGFFTARQAKVAGYADNTHPHHVRAGNWIRERRGIYRLARFPLAARPDLIIWQLWSHNRRGEPQGTYSHSTALSLHQLSDVMPAKLDMTVPPGFQRMAAIPRALRLHGGRLAEDDVEAIEGVRVTTPLRTLVDVIVDGQIATELQVQAVQEALRRGLVIRRQFDLLQTSRRARQRIHTVLKQVPDGDSTPVRHRRGLPGGTRNATARAVTARRR
jgi:predicted transcriptional regulator of viral defense system